MPTSSAEDYGEALAAGVRRAVARAVPSLDGRALNALMADAVALGDDAFAKLRQQDPPKHPLSCAEGCARCCRLYVQASPLEVLHAARSILADRSRAEVAAIRARVALAASIVRGMDARERAVAGVPCPLLENERCTAYRARPIACRGANSADAGACQSVAGNPDDVQIPSYTHQRKVLLHTRQWDRRGPAGGGRAEPSARTRGRARPRSRPRRPTGGVAVRRPRLQRGALQGGRPGGGAGGPRMNPR